MRASRAARSCSRGCWRCPTPRWTRALIEVLTSFSARHDDLVGLLDERFALVARHVEDAGRPLARAASAHRCVHEPGVRDRVRRPVQPVDGGAPRPERAAGGCHPVRHERPRGRRGARVLRRAAHRRGRRRGRAHVRHAGADDDRAGPPRHRALPRDLRRQNDELAGDRDDADALLRSLPDRLPADGGRGEPAARVVVARARTTSTFPARQCDRLPGAAARAAPPSGTASRTFGWSRSSTPTGGARYLGTYTAFDGESVAPHLRRDRRLHDVPHAAG